MKLKTGGTCDCSEECEERDFIIFMTKPFQFRWFMDCGEWFMYIYFGKRYYRFSSAGFMKGRVKE